MFEGVCFRSMGLLISFIFRKILLGLLTTLGFSLVRVLINTGLKKSSDAQDKMINEIVKVFVGLLGLALVVGISMLVVRIVIVIF